MSRARRLLLGLWVALVAVLAVAPTPSEAWRRGTPRTILWGTNLSGFDSGGSAYALPSTQAVDYAYGRGMRVFRVTFNLTRMLSAPGGALNATYLARYKSLIDHVLTLPGATAIVDPHSFGRYTVGATFDDYNGPSGGTEVVIGESASFTAAQFADFWVRLSAALPDARLIYELQNEPHDQDSAALAATNNAAIAAIRAAGHANHIVVPFNGYSNRYTFAVGAASQGPLLNSIVDPGNNWSIQYHMYMDPYSPGNSATIQANFLDDVAAFTVWMRANGKRGCSTEFGGASDAASLAALGTYVAHLAANRDVWACATYWTMVQYQDEDHAPQYIYQLLPRELGGGGVAGPYTDRPQMGVLAPFMQ